MSLIRATSYEAAVENGTAYFIISFREISNNDIVDFAITAPTTAPPTIGLSFDADPSGEVLIEVFRDSVLNATPGGTVIPLFNSNEASGNVALTEVLENPAIDNDGTRVANSQLGAGRSNQTAGQGDKTNVIYLAAEDGTTLIRMTSGQAGNVVNFTVRVIEEAT